MDDIPQHPKYLPLIFALKDLQIRYYPAQFNSPEEFSRSACLLRGDSILPMVEDADIEARLRTARVTELPPDPMASLMRLDMSDWPDDAFLAVRGILAFGPGDDKLATECALHSLKLNRNCRLARQLLQLLSDEKDVRIPFGEQGTEVQDVLTKMMGSHLPDKAEKQPWWKL